MEPSGIIGGAEIKPESETSKGRTWTRSLASIYLVLIWKESSTRENALSASNQKEKVCLFIHPCAYSCVTTWVTLGASLFLLIDFI